MHCTPQVQITSCRPNVLVNCEDGGRELAGDCGLWGAPPHTRGRTTLPAAASWVGTPSLFISHTLLLDLLHTSKEVRNRWFQVPKVAGPHLPGMTNALASPPAQASGCSTGWFGKMLVGQKQGPATTQLGRCGMLQPQEQTPTAALQDAFFMEARSRWEKKFRPTTW